MSTISELAKAHGLSRSTLLYYDRIGLLRPGGHARGEYRHYGAADEERLRRICEFRRAGLSLKAIQRLLDNPAKGQARRILEKRLLELSAEMQLLREQQALLSTLLGRGELVDELGPLTRESWMNLLRAAGFSNADMMRWHVQFEHSDPEKHEAFLQHLRIDPREILSIREWARNKEPTQT